WRCAIPRSYGFSLSGGRSRSRTRSISAIVPAPFSGAIFRRVFELLEAAAAIDRHAFEPVRLGRHELGGVVRIGVEVLHDDPVGAQAPVDASRRLSVVG